MPEMRLSSAQLSRGDLREAIAASAFLSSEASSDVPRRNRKNTKKSFFSENFEPVRCGGFRCKNWRGA